MTSVKVKFRPSSVEGREGSLYIRLIHRRQIRMLPTGLKIYPSEWDPVRAEIRLVDGDAGRIARLLEVKERLETGLDAVERCIALLRCRGEFHADEVTEIYRNRMQNRGFFYFMEGEIRRLTAAGRYKTASGYACALRNFRAFREGREVEFESFDRVLLEQFQAALKARGVSLNTVSFYMRILRAVYNKAAGRGLTVRRSPFKYVYTGIEKTEKRAVDEKLMNRLRQADLSFSPSLAFARDLFLCSFYMRGMSFVDMCYLKKEDVTGDLLSYRRRKTGQRLYVRIEACAGEIIRRYEKDAADSPYLFPQLFLSNPRPLEVQHQNALRLHNKRLKAISARMGLSVPLTSYVSRHTWASVAHRNGIPLRIISEGMGHDSENTTRIYLASLDQSVLDEANRKIVCRLDD